MTQLKPAKRENMKNSEYVKSIVLDLLFTLLTCGLFNIWIQYRQIVTVNKMLNQEKYHFLLWLIFSIITVGLYHIYHEYIISEDIAKVVGREPGHDGIINLLLSVFALSWVADAIQQHHINEYYK
ncbi:MAG: hypothetical protein A2381_15805 [Bdellovibrionales bacterium RIFOXYB1_FULL_37_110]|nr:MAG: hypothetical protein A2417_07655 [Bdellovibrionales bacterium RIFOXYC1_FULL_37_79]OFZ57080.1 MAG: hypothetical protein A2381_15805 [Bdellovibrionales bacterium RIFOXYB1_FULL_37_110]OFZ62069.1 MAG: hypothetical protein A2577_08425 [Bdellovibrionales bacterium RIFOXYD1_FULL_36_51]